MYLILNGILIHDARGSKLVQMQMKAGTVWYLYILPTNPTTMNSPMAYSYLSIPEWWDEVPYVSTSTNELQ